MTGARWTILFLGGAAGTVRQFSVPRRFVRPLLAVVCTLAALFAGAAAFLVYDSSARLRASNLALENRLLEDKVASLQQQAREVDGRMAWLAERIDRTRLLAGQTGIDRDVMKVGVGGPGLEAVGEDELWSLDPAASELAFKVGYDLDVVERQIDLLEGSLDETLPLLEGQQERFEAMPSIFPVGVFHLSSGFSHRRFHPVHLSYMPHRGIDMSAARGTPIVASGPGVVTFAGSRLGYGRMVEIDHGFGVISRYAHASKLLVHRGQRVKRKEVIAHVGCSGTCKAPHLHFEIHQDGQPINPLVYMLP
ncbi:MAG: M23 family metallopeptidase [Gemmatimonadetes bacterium]|nr:M23 family metallopeptidase [Gemmatimonadota bacterium]